MSLADPHHVVQLLVEGMLALERDPVAGEALLVHVLAKPLLSSDGARVHDRSALDRLRARADIARSYLGGTPATNYAIADGARVTFDTSNPHAGVDYPEPAHAKLFVACGGADSPRPVELRRNARFEWKVTSWSSLTVGVKPPASAADDF